MKTQMNPIRNAECGVRSENKPALAGVLRSRAAFTLIELLVVIAIMAIIAGFMLVVVHGLKITQSKHIATAELGQIESALEDYKAKYGVYPPSNANPPGTYTLPLTNSLLPQLYYELSGVTNNGAYFVTLDGSARIRVQDVQSAFGVGGFINCSKGSGDDASAAKDFILGLRQKQIGSVLNDNGVPITNIITSVRGPDLNYMPISGEQDVNPFRYVYPGVNNPNSYDLWVKLTISGKTYLVCNWSKQIIINSPLP